MENLQVQTQPQKQPETICWNCKRCTGLCSWSKYLKPVKGWEATATNLRVRSGGYVKSFIVSKCPLFVPDYKKKVKKESSRHKAKSFKITDIFKDCGEALNLSTRTVQIYYYKRILAIKLKKINRIDLIEKYKL